MEIVPMIQPIGLSLGDVVDVVIVGAGLSGLSAARELVSRGLSVRILEATDRVGGRTLSSPLGADVIDLGGQWLGPTQDHMYKLVEEFGLKIFPQYDNGKKVLYINERLSTYRGAIPSLSVFALMDLHRAISRLERLSMSVDLDNPYASPDGQALSGMTLATWKQKHMRTRDAQAVVDAAVGAIFGASPDEISMLYFLWYCKCGGGLMRLALTVGGANQDRISGGAQQIALRMAEQLGSAVTLNSPVRAIVQDETGVTVQTDTAGWRGRYVIVAVPPSLTLRIAFDPLLPSTRDALCRRFPMGSLVKCIVAYEKPFWRNARLSGESVSNTGPLCVTFDDSPEDARQGAIVGFVAGDEARRFGSLSPKRRQTKVLEQLSEMFGPSAGTPTAYIDKDWSAEEWTRGCPVGFMVPGGMTSDFGRDLRNPFGRVHWAGTETATRWAGYMEGAVEAGLRTANEIQSRK